MEKGKARDIDIEKIRALACCIVIAVHVNDFAAGDPGDKSKILYRVLFGDGVALFFILAGCFLFQNASFIRLLKKTFQRIVVPFLAVMLLSYTFYPWINQERLFFDCMGDAGGRWKELLVSLLNWSHGGYHCEHLWYIFTYVQVILLFPLLKPLCRKENHKYIVYIIALNLAGLLVNDAKVFTAWPVTPYFILSVPVVYLLTGYLIYQNKDRIRNNRGLRWLSFSVLAGTELIRWMLQIKLYGLGDNSYYLFWNTGAAVLASTSCFLFLYSFEMKCDILKKAVFQISDSSFYIYLVHYGVIFFLDARGFRDAVLRLFHADGMTQISNAAEPAYVLIRGVVVLAVSFGISKLIKGLGRFPALAAGKRVA